MLARRIRSTSLAVGAIDAWFSGMPRAARGDPRERGRLHGCCRSSSCGRSARVSGALRDSCPLRSRTRCHRVHCRADIHLAATATERIAVYRPPGSESSISGSGLRVSNAMFNAASGRSVVSCSVMDQPTTLRLNASMTTAKWTKPLQFRNSFGQQHVAHIARDAHVVAPVVGALVRDTKHAASSSHAPTRLGIGLGRAQEFDDGIDVSTCLAASRPYLHQDVALQINLAEFAPQARLLFASGCPWPALPGKQLPVATR